MCDLQSSNLLFIFTMFCIKRKIKNNNKKKNTFNTGFQEFLICALQVVRFIFVCGGSGALLHSMWHRFAVFTNATQFLFLTQIVPSCPPVS